jgi:hypothetical protein
MLAQSLGDLHCVINGRVREQDDELVTGVARDDIVRATQRAKHLGDSPKRRVALKVTEGVVDLLEVIDIDDRDRGLVPTVDYRG